VKEPLLPVKRRIALLRRDSSKEVIPFEKATAAMPYQRPSNPGRKLLGAIGGTILSSSKAYERTTSTNCETERSVSSASKKKSTNASAILRSQTR